MVPVAIVKGFMWMLNFHISVCVMVDMRDAIYNLPHDYLLFLFLRTNQLSRMPAYPLSFDNSEHAFAYKSDKELKKAKFLFTTMTHHWLVKLGTKITPWAIEAGLPMKKLIRHTIFD